MRRVLRFLATAEHPLARASREVYRRMASLSVPAPTILARPALWLFVGLRRVYYFVARVFVCEPLFKAACASYGRGVHTGVFVHWMSGSGDLRVGANVVVDGKSSFIFARRFAETPELIIGDDTTIGHNCIFVVGQRIEIGRKCLIAQDVRVADSPGHPSDPAKRLAGLPPDPEQVRPISIGENVWIGAAAVILPGVTIGDNCVVAASAVVTRSVPPNKVVLGNPARVISFLPDPGKRVQPD
jgi:acetyltransferase-like isoleucine patch superfamily enzyme